MDLNIVLCAELKNMRVTRRSIPAPPTSINQFVSANDLRTKRNANVIDKYFHNARRVFFYYFIFLVQRFFFFLHVGLTLMFYTICGSTRTYVRLSPAVLQTPSTMDMGRGGHDNVCRCHD